MSPEDKEKALMFYEMYVQGNQISLKHMMEALIKKNNIPADVLIELNGFINQQEIMLGSLFINLEPIMETTTYLKQIRH